MGEEEPLEKDIFYLKLGEILVKYGIINNGQLQHVLDLQKKTGKKLGEILIEEGMASEQMITDILAQQHKLPMIDLNKVEPKEIVFNLFPPSYLKKHNIAPVEVDGDYVVVAINDPLDFVVLQELKNMSNYKIRLVMASLSDIKNYLDKHFGDLRSVTEAIKEISAKDSLKEEDLPLEELEAKAQDAPIVKLVNSVITEAVKQKASDVHFEPQKKNLRIRFRVDGILYEKMIIPKELQAAVISRIKIISGMDIAERRKPQDGRISLGKDAPDVDVRVSTLPDIFGEKIVLRLLDKKSILKPLEKLGMNEEELRIVKNLISKPYGMILVTGPTGSGKTTTLYSILNILNDESRNIVTVEDPVEYELEGINQTHINVRAGYTFATAIRHILRQDPDVIMVGEIRDAETAEIAIQSALTGHLVFSTLHTNTASGAITRLLDMNIEPFLIGSAVIGVIAQRLVRQLCPFCKEEYIPTSSVWEWINSLLPVSQTITLVKPKGCDKCFGMGYKGRVGIFEIFAMDDSIRELVLKRSTELEIAKVAISKGMDILKISGLKKALAKITSLEEVSRVAFVEGI
ncbi:MAG: Flp pilus assembly complex ATPase component TadA [Candidatus Omnitrophica bacterium]|nr:Flp pilus assembly complex ATPase component TadA [Candidatus Omnitrophota bacterium]